MISHPSMHHPSSCVCVHVLGRGSELITGECSLLGFEGEDHEDCVQQEG